MASSNYFDTVHKLYIAFYGRPAEAKGLYYWSGKIDEAGGNASSVIDAFAGENEAKELYAGSSNSETITQIYEQLLGRNPDADGLAFWVKQVEDKKNHPWQSRARCFE